jgi:FxsC-like protein
MAQVNPAFPQSAIRADVAGARGAPAAPPPVGPKHTRYICVAASRDEMVSIRQNSAKYYGGEGDWIPYHLPVPDDADFIVCNAAVQAHLIPTATRCPRSMEDFQRLLRDWNDANVVVAIVIDPWSLRIPALRDAIYALERNPFPNWCRIFVWDVEDETRQAQEVLNREMKEIFAVSLSAAASDALDHTISDQAALRSELEKRLTEAKNKVVKMLGMRPFSRGQMDENRSAPPAINVYEQR